MEKLACTFRLGLVLGAIVVASLLMPRGVAADAKEAMARGDFLAAISQLRQALADIPEGDAAARLHLQLASAYHGHGQSDLAIHALGKAIAMGAGDTVARARVAEANVFTWTRAFAKAEASLALAQQFNAELDDQAMAAEIDMVTGLLEASRGAFVPARSAFERAAATEAAPLSLRAAAAVNAARAAAKVGDVDSARRWTAQARSLGDKLEDSHAKASLLVAMGSLQQVASAADRHAALSDAAGVAQRLNDQPVLVAALLEMAELYTAQNRPVDALRLTRRAAFVAQQTALPDLTYKAQWQTGRLLAEEKKLDEAIAALARALDTVESIRPDLTVRYSPVADWPEDATEPAPTFRRVIGPLYFELADLYFQRADKREGKDAEDDLLAARDTVEKFRSAEIKDYFDERCVELVTRQRRAITDVGEGTAVVYFVPLRDRLEILVTRGVHLQRFKSPVAAADLDAMAEQFRRQVETRGSYRFMALARKLHDVLIGPILPGLSGDVDTLVFVPDGSLRTVPMAALYDGKTFLIERYAVAVSPGMDLMEPRAIRRQNVKVLLSGVSEARKIDGEPFARLPYVPGELDRIGREFGATPLLDADFTVPRVQGEVAQLPYNVVHIATHGEFRSEAADSFLLAYDEKMTLDKLEQIIRPAQFRGEPVELLTLSACRTAAGDDRAALGLAGVAIKAGARSALATLWYVNDETSSIVVSRFYELLKSDPSLSKAQALQRAQAELIRFTDEDGRPHIRHPSLWSPYLIIGNWL